MGYINSIANSFSEAKAYAFQTKIDFAVARKALDTQRMEGSSLLKLIDKSSQTAKLWTPGENYRPGSIIDFYA